MLNPVSSWAGMIEHWAEHRNIEMLTQWLEGTPQCRTWGNIEHCEQHRIDNFLHGLQSMPAELIRGAPLLFPEEDVLIAKTKSLRLALAAVPAIAERIDATPSKMREWGLHYPRDITPEYQCALYPTSTVKQKIDDVAYDHHLEYARLRVGESPNWNWWIHQSWSENTETHRSTEWPELFQQLLSISHPRQGFLLSLAMVQVRRHPEWKDKLPSVLNVLDAPIKICDEMPLLFLLGRMDIGQAPPDARWRKKWQDYCQESPYEAQQTLVYLTAARLRMNLMTSTTLLEANLHGWDAAMRWASLEKSSIGSMMRWKKEEGYTGDALVQAILNNMPNRLVRLLDGFNFVEQWMTLLPFFVSMAPVQTPVNGLDLPSILD